MPKFKVGQIVCAKTGKQLPFRVLEVIEYEEMGTFYKWNRRNAIAESSLRSLNSEEIGNPDHPGGTR